MKKSKSIFLLILSASSCIVLLYLLINFQKNRAPSRPLAAGDIPPKGVCHNTDGPGGGPSLWLGPVVNEIGFDQVVIADSPPFYTDALVKIPADTSLFGAVFKGVVWTWSGGADSIGGGLWGKVKLIIKTPPPNIINAETGVAIASGGIQSSVSWCGDMDGLPSVTCTSISPPKKWQVPLYFPVGPVELPFKFYVEPQGYQGAGNGRYWIKVQNIRPIYLGGCSMPSGWTYNPRDGSWTDPDGNRWFWDPCCGNPTSCTKGCWRKGKTVVLLSSASGKSCTQVCESLGGACSTIGVNLSGNNAMWSTYSTSDNSCLTGWILKNDPVQARSLLCNHSMMAGSVYCVNCSHSNTSGPPLCLGIAGDDPYPHRAEWAYCKCVGVPPTYALSIPTKSRFPWSN